MTDRAFPLPDFVRNLPLPEDWEEKVNPSNGRKYFANSKTRKTTYDDPRLLPLPLGWEMKWDSKNNKPYFSDYHTRTTTYDDPRLKPNYTPPPTPTNTLPSYAQTNNRPQQPQIPNQGNSGGMTPQQRQIAQMMSGMGQQPQIPNQGNNGGMTPQQMQMAQMMSGMGQQPQQRASVDIVINGKQCTEQEIQILRNAGSPCLPGRYWYDHRAGGFGYEGGPTLMWGTPGLKVGGPLRPNASNGTTGVFINGRQLHVQDVINWTTYIGPVSN